MSWGGGRERTLKLYYKIEKLSKMNIKRKYLKHNKRIEDHTYYFDQKYVTRTYLPTEKNNRYLPKNLNSTMCCNKKQIQLKLSQRIKAER